MHDRAFMANEDLWGSGKGRTPWKTPRNPKEFEPENWELQDKMFN